MPFSLISSFCSSGQMFAAGFLQIPPRDGHPCPWLYTSRYRACYGLAPIRECSCWANIKKQVAKSFSGHLFFIASPQKYPHLVISTGGPVDRSGERPEWRDICISESHTNCRCLGFVRHDNRGGFAYSHFLSAIITIPENRKFSLSLYCKIFLL